MITCLNKKYTNLWGICSVLNKRFYYRSCYAADLWSSGLGLELEIIRIVNKKNTKPTSEEKNIYFFMCQVFLLIEGSSLGFSNQLRFGELPVPYIFFLIYVHKISYTFWQSWAWRRFLCQRANRGPKNVFCWINTVIVKLLYLGGLFSQIISEFWIFSL